MTIYKLKRAFCDNGNDNGNGNKMTMMTVELIIERLPGTRFAPRRALPEEKNTEIPEMQKYISTKERKYKNEKVMMTMLQIPESNHDFPVAEDYGCEGNHKPAIRL